MTKYAEVTAVILAGGLGTRLRGVVSDRPKVLASVKDRPFLSYLLQQLADSGIRKTVLCTGYLGGQIEKTFGSSYLGMQIAYSLESEPLGTGGALRQALPLLDTEQVLVLNGDSFCTLDHQVFFDFHAQRRAAMSICLTEVGDVSRYGAVKLDSRGRILAFEEKGASSGAGTINAGVYLIRRSVIAAIPDAVAVSLEKEVITTRIGTDLYGYNSNGRFIDIGVPADYQAAQQFFG